MNSELNKDDDTLTATYQSHDLFKKLKKMNECVKCFPIILLLIDQRTNEWKMKFLFLVLLYEQSGVSLSF